MVSHAESIGSATRLVQGYPTQVWLPQSDRARRERHFALLHDRRDCNDQPGIFFMPGNAQRKLEENPQTMDVVDDGQLRRLRIPAALLWDFHGGPCTRGGTRYRQIGASTLNQIYRGLELGKPSVLRDDDKELYIGPFDRVLWPDSDDMRKFSPMDPRLVGHDQ